MSNIVKKQYYRITFKLASPVNVGSGNNAETDKDIIRNSRGIPYIPGTSIAGVSKEAVKGLGEDILRVYFGDVAKADRKKTSGENLESRIVFYDAEIKEGTAYVSVRDSVALDEYKTAKKGYKFDMEVIEPGVSFVTYIEQNFFSPDDENVTYEIIQQWLNNNIRLGSKTTRGYGEINTVEAITKAFDMTSAESVNEWLEFDMYSAWTDATPVMPKKIVEKSIKLSLIQNSGISIRKYTTDVNDIKSGIAVPDMEQLTLHEGNLPTIPGSTWAGALRHRMEELGCPKEKINSLFGNVDSESKTKSKSIIRFHETTVKGAVAKTATRNAINRFSGGAKDRALFTEKTFYNGRTLLKISFRDTRIDEEAAKYLAAAITDLNYGFLSVGGLTSIGRGLFSITEINGSKVEESKIYSTVYEILCKEAAEYDS